MVDVKAIKEYFFSNNLERNDSIYFDTDALRYNLCELLTPQENARARKAIMNGGFFTFGYNGLSCCGSREDAYVKRFFKRNYKLDWEEH